MKCPKCGSENVDNAKFCSSCGEELKTTTVTKTRNNKKIIIALLAVIIVLGVLVVYTSGILNSGLELETQSYDGFEIGVPADSKFVLDESYTTDPNNVFVSYLNKGKHFYDVGGFIVGMNMTDDKVPPNYKFEETDGDLEVYKSDEDGITIYEVIKKGNDANVMVMGSDLVTLKNMANSFKDKDFKKLASTSSSSSSTTSSESGSWTSIGSYSGSGSGSKSVTVPAGKIKVELSAYPIKNYATNHLYVTSSSGSSGGVDWGSTSAVETRSDSFTFTSSGSETLNIEYYETVSWNVEIYKYQ